MRTTKMKKENMKIESEVRKAMVGTFNKKVPGRRMRVAIILLAMAFLILTVPGATLAMEGVANGSVTSGTGWSFVQGSGTGVCAYDAATGNNANGSLKMTEPGGKTNFSCTATGAGAATLFTNDRIESVDVYSNLGWTGGAIATKDLDIVVDGTTVYLVTTGTADNTGAWVNSSTNTNAATTLPYVVGSTEPDIIVTMSGKTANGGAATWYIDDISVTFTSMAVNDAPTLSALAQYKSNGSTSIGSGTGTDETTVVFKSTVADIQSQDVYIEVEVATATGSYTGTPSCTSTAVSAGTTATATCTNLTPNTNYKWRARGVDIMALAGSWYYFGGTDTNDIDFYPDTMGPSVTTTAPMDLEWVNADVSVTINFNESVNCTTVNTTNVTIWPTPGTSWTRTSCTGSTAVFQPIGQVDDVQYEVTVSTSVTDSIGSPMESAKVLKYRTVPTTGNPQFEIFACNACHGMPPFDAPTVRNSPTGYVIGYHANSLHVSGTNKEDCEKCHAIPGQTEYDHRDNMVSMNSTNIQGYTSSFYDKDKSGGQTGADDSFAQSRDSDFTTTGNCVNVLCHSNQDNAASPSWGYSSGRTTCGRCHGMAQGYAASDLQGHTVATDEEVGAHAAHLTPSSVNNYRDPISCDNCHPVPSDVTDSTHYDTNAIGIGNSASVVFSGLATNFGNTAASYNSSTGYCSLVYCHGNGLPGGDTTGADRTPKWFDPTYLTAESSLATGADCDTCHGGPPVGVATHTGGMTFTQCNNCHPDTVNGIGNITGLDKHINGEVEKVVDCMKCHNGQAGSIPRAKIYDETATAAQEGSDFTTRTSRHINIGTVTNYDCILCHAAGDSSSSSVNGILTVASKHGQETGDKTIWLRNVDASTTSWSWPGKRNAAYTATSTDRDNMDSFCMGCHDSDGASDIQVNSDDTGMITGAATRAFTPFTFTDGGTPLNVKDQFNSTNQVGTGWASHHNLNQFTKRYGTGYASNLTGIWTGTSQDGVTFGTAGQGNGFSIGLHCSDCHVNEQNAHGAQAAGEMMLLDSSGNDAASITPASDAATGTIVCFRCHASAVYELNGASAGNSRYDHASNDHPYSIGTYGPTAGGNHVEIICLNCHSPYAPNYDDTGGIHGTNWSGVDGAGVGTGGGTATKAYRFSMGRMMYLNNETDGTWTTTGSVTCYTPETATGINDSACEKHSGSSGGSNTSYQSTRGLQ
jgi:predicted CxxxxCH...CXXCH cytochrome family protein